MPIEIGELEIRARIENPADSGEPQQNNPLNTEEIVQEAVEQVMEILRRKAAL